MKAVERKVCPVCGNEFSGAVEYCPVCMLRGAPTRRIEPGESSDAAQERNESTATRISHRFENYELRLDQHGKPVELGRGAMGVTYKAFDVDLRCPVALKVINDKYLADESARLRFLREARAGCPANSSCRAGDECDGSGGRRHRTRASSPRARAGCGCCASWSARCCGCRRGPSTTPTTSGPTATG